MIRTHPRPSIESTALRECIEACYDCAQTCTSCADACLGEPQVADLVKCIRLNLDCASVCQATGEVLSRLTETDRSLVRPLLQACLEACRACGTECQRHAGHMEHCRVCAEACRRCESACRAMLDSL
jgi:hypothetical protein